MTVRTLLSALALFLLPLGAAQAEDSFFDGLTGNWRGSGFVRITARAPEENIRCRLTSALHPGGQQLILFGSCAIGGFMLPVDGSIISKGKSTYSATIFRTLARLTTSSFPGKRRGSKLSFSFKGRDSVTRQEISATMTIRKRGSGFDISMSRTDPELNVLFDVGTISFRGG